VQHVTGGASGHRLSGRAQGLPQPGDMDPQRADRPLGRIPTPQVLSQAVRRDGPVGIEDEESQQGPLPAATKGQALTGAHHLQRTENPELERERPFVAHRPSAWAPIADRAVRPALPLGNPSTGC